MAKAIPAAVKKFYATAPSPHRETMLEMRDRILEIVLGLDRQGKSRTTHIYILDGGPTWGQWSKEVNGKIEVEGTRDPSVVSNYLVFY